MRPHPIQGATRVMVAPANWDAEKKGPCKDLQIVDTFDDRGDPVMLSAWKPDHEDIKDMLEGKPIMLMIQGRGHPVVALFMGELVEG